MKDGNDFHLLKALSEGSTEAFEQFYYQYHSFVFTIALKILHDQEDAKDITHDIFIEISKKADTYAPHKGSIEAWLAIRTRSRCLDLIRRKREITSEDVVTRKEKMSVTQDSIEETVMFNIDKQILSNALRKLPKQQAKAILGNYYHQFSQKELSDILKIPLGTVKSQIRYGISNLRKQLLNSSKLNSTKGDEKHDM